MQPLCREAWKKPAFCQAPLGFIEDLARCGKGLNLGLVLKALLLGNQSDHENCSFPRQHAMPERWVAPSQAAMLTESADHKWAGRCVHLTQLPCERGKLFAPRAPKEPSTRLPRTYSHLVEFYCHCMRIPGLDPAYQGMWPWHIRSTDWPRQWPLRNSTKEPAKSHNP